MKSRHPTTVLVSSGLVIVLALLPLYFGQLEPFRSIIGNRARLIGLLVATVAFVIGSWTILNHSGRRKGVDDSDEPGATETWLKAVDLVWKFAAAIAVVVATNWFAIILKEQQQRKEEAEKRVADDAKRRSAEDEVARHKLEEDEANFARSRDSVMQLLLNPSPSVRLLGVANSLDLVSGHLPIARTLFAVALHDSDEAVRQAAARPLPEGLLQVDEKFDCSKAILQLGQLRVEGRSSLAPLTSEGRYALLQLLTAIQQVATNPEDQVKAQMLATKLNQSQIAEASAASDAVAKQAPEAGLAETAEQKKVDTFANAVVFTAATASDFADVKKATAVLENTSAEAVNASIRKLPDAVVKTLPPRVYLHIADESQRGAARTWQAKLTQASYISPGIQNVARKGYIPDTLEVRYFAADSKSAAEAILKVIRESGAKDGRVSYVIPTANDLRISPDIKSHFEVWTGKATIEQSK